MKNLLFGLFLSGIILSSGCATIKIPPCHVMQDIGTYEGEANYENAKTIVLDALLQRNADINLEYLEVNENRNDVIEVLISHRFSRNLCHNGEEDSTCIGQWVQLKEGKLMMEFLNPC